MKHGFVILGHQLLSKISKTPFLTRRTRFAVGAHASRMDSQIEIRPWPRKHEIDHPFQRWSRNLGRQGGAWVVAVV